MTRHCVSKSTSVDITQDLIFFYRNLTTRLHNLVHPSKNPALSSLLAGSLTSFSRYFEQIPQPAKTELRDLSSVLQVHVKSLCAVVRNISEMETGLDHLEIRNELELTLDLMTSYSSLLNNRPKFDHSKLLRGVTHSPPLCAKLSTYIN